ncbi:ligase-associated DNA damage response endonuclease PdeM [Paracoccaceae bacterium GXU_MW_L88]
MTTLPFRFAGQSFFARPARTLWWPARRALVLADLHLGKSERMARRGGALLPPYETQDTLDRLEAELDATQPDEVFLLGDSFDDDFARDALPDAVTARIEGLTRHGRWRWIAGNHDGGAAIDEMSVDGIALRHIAGQGPDISGHYHPKAIIARQRVPVFVVGRNHLIMPAFGTYTGGLLIDDPALSPLAQGRYVITTGRSCRCLPVR